MRTPDEEAAPVKRSRAVHEIVFDRSVAGMRGLHSRSAFGLAGWAFGTYLVGLTVYVLFAPAEPVTRKDLFNVCQLVTSILAGACCLRASTKIETRMGKASWRLIAFAFGFYVLGQLLWLYYDIFLGNELPADTPAALAMGLFYPFAFLGLALQVRPGQTGPERMTILLDALTFTIACFGLAWVLVMGPYLASVPDPVATALNVVWPLGDLLIILALVSSLLSWPLAKVPVPSLYLLAAFLVQIVADIVFAVLLVTGEYQQGNWSDALWGISNSIAAIAAVSAGNNRKTGESEERWRSTVNLSWSANIRVMLPYLSLPMALWMLFASIDHGDHLAGGAAPVHVASVIVIALVLLRQLMMVVSHHNLSKSLAQLSNELEDRVAARTSELAERTAELDALHGIARALSQCDSSDQVLDTGLQMACAATSSSTGVVWLSGQDGPMRVAARFHVPESADGLLADVAENVRSYAAGFAKGEAHSMAIDCHTAAEDSAELSADFPPPHLLASLDLPPILLIAPLVSRGAVLGVLALMGERVEDGAKPRLNLLEAIGAEMGTALEGVQRFEHATFLADRDPVTGLYNHRAFHRLVSETIKRQQRAARPFSLLMMDVDGFKLFNDTYGHPTGDQVLKSVGNVLANCARESDSIARYGGDEFAAILPDTTAENARVFAERVRTDLAERPFARRDGVPVPLHMSFGVATYPEDGHTSHELVNAADTHLYESKSRGGDTVTVAPNSATRDLPKLGTFGVLDGLVTAVDHKDRYTRKHSEQVTRLAVSIAEAMGLSEETQRSVRVAGLLHDVGKIGVPDRVLRKPGGLDEDEYNVVKQHAMLGEIIVKDVPNTEDVATAIGAHHERYDGRGYPRGLKGEEIPLLGRILAVADAYSAMTTDRSYRKGLSASQAKAELLKSAGSQLDPQIVGLFLSRNLDESGERGDVQSPRQELVS